MSTNAAEESTTATSSRTAPSRLESMGNDSTGEGDQAASTNSSSISSFEAAPRMSEQERRASIQSIMKDKSLNETERRRSIQNLMDGRRRSSLVNFRRSISFKRQSSGVSDCSADDFDDDSKASNPSNVNGTPGTPGRKSSFNRRQLLKRSYSEPIHETSAYTGDEDASFMHSLKLDEMNLNEKVFKNCAFNINGEPSGDPKKLVEASPVCPHYERKCSIISPCCGLVFGCRICHDDCDQLGPPVFNKEDDDAEDDSSQHVPRKIKLECGGAKAKFGRRGSMSSIMSSISESGDDVHHNIDRFAIEEVICRECHTRQTSKRYV